MTGETVKGDGSRRTSKIGMRSLLLLFVFSFLVGFYGSTLYLRSQEDEHGLRPRAWARLPDLTKEEAEYHLRAGESAYDSITPIPFQVRDFVVLKIRKTLRATIPLRCFLLRRFKQPRPRAGESGDDSITSIPFQVLSWRPHTLYFPNFATSEQCDSIIDRARGLLKLFAITEGRR